MSRSIPQPDGLLHLKAVPAAVLRHAGAEADPVAQLRARYRLVWDAAIKDQRVPAERIGKRWFLRAEHVPALAAALGVLQVPPVTRKPDRQRKVATPSNVVAA